MNKEYDSIIIKAHELSLTSKRALYDIYHDILSKLTIDFNLKHPNLYDENLVHIVHRATEHKINIVIARHHNTGEYNWLFYNETNKRDGEYLRKFKFDNTFEADQQFLINEWGIKL